MFFTLKTKKKKSNVIVMWKLKLLKFFRLILCILAVVMLGSIGAFFSIPAIPTWYAKLSKPAFVPPNALFGPVWTLLFILIGISLFLVLEEGVSKKKMSITPILIFIVQMILNIFWSVFFFGLRSPLLGFIDIILLDATVIWMTLNYYKIRKEATYLLIPYIVWILFATYLNLSILILN